MPRPLSLLPALLAVAVTATVGFSAVPATAAAAQPDDPLQVQIDSLTPSTVPAKGQIRLRGTVTNVSDERWRAINVHPFMSDQPITSANELADAVDTPADAYVGNRITEPGTFDSVGSLNPGETVSFSIRLPRDELPASEPGVYWFGVHALGNTDEARDDIADGRDRTFLPLVPASRGSVSHQQVDVSLVLPLRRAIRHRPNGRIRAPGRWARDVSPGGRLDGLVDLATAPDAGPLTWLVDPAVPDAVGRLVAGNPPRSLSDTVTPESGGDGTEEPSPSGSAEPAGGDTTTDGDTATGDEAGGNPVAASGAAWLARLRAALGTADVLSLPYGDPDLAGAAASDAAFYDRARRRTGTQLDRWQVSTAPAVGSPSGYLAPDELGLLHGDETVLASDVALPDGEPRGVATIDGHRVLVTSSSTATGGPGPQDRLSAIALRQRVLADAALRLLFHDATPLVVVLPKGFAPEDPEQFWSGLDPNWLRLVDTGELRGGDQVDPDELVYPEQQEQAQLGATAFDAAESLIGAGRTLEAMLTNNDQVADQVLDQALTSVGYAARAEPLEWQSDTVRSTDWIGVRLHNVRLGAPKGVTLASQTGNFAATINNRLRHPVTVSLAADTPDGIDVRPPALIQLAAGGRQTVVLEASATSPGVHYVRLVVTDADGTPLGAAQQVPIRSAQVSRVIWVILGVGVGLLFLAIAVRVVRRVRNERT